jgi:hypothetical protein
MIILSFTRLLAINAHGITRFRGSIQQEEAIDAWLFQELSTIMMMIPITMFSAWSITTLILNNVDFLPYCRRTVFVDHCKRNLHSS